MILERSGPLSTEPVVTCEHAAHLVLHVAGLLRAQSIEVTWSIHLYSKVFKSCDNADSGLTVYARICVKVKVGFFSSVQISTRTPVQLNSPGSKQMLVNHKESVE